MTANTLPGWLHPLVAHRGLHGPGVPENSLAACRAAIDAGYAIEIDVQLSSDGEAMVFHDATLERLTEASGPIEAQTAAALGALALIGTDETIPTLGAVLAVVGDRVPLLVEIKDRSGDYSATDGSLEARVAELLAAHAGDAAVMSFNPEIVDWFRRNAPEIPRGLVAGDLSDEPGVSAARATALAALTDLDRVAPGFVAYDKTGLDHPAVRAARERLPVLTWTVRSQAEADAAAPLADGLIFEDFTPTAAAMSRAS